jgi:SAM-dependent methyltransferase
MAYIKQAFDVVAFDQAKNVVLTTDPNDPSKFERETQFLINAIKKENIINPNDVVLDFGCGMGRISKELVYQLDAQVIGIDISDSMLTFATLYVSNLNKFKTANSYDILEGVDVAIASLVLQHVEYPTKAIEALVSALKPNGYLVVLNEHIRMVPADIDNRGYVIWKDDEFNVFAEIEKYLTLEKSVPYMNSAVDILFYRKDKS